MRLLETRADGARLQRAFALEVRAVGDTGEIEGYGSVFGVRDSYDDVILPGAFKASLDEHAAAGTMPALLWQHRADEPIGIWIAMSEDARGLKVSGRLALDTERGREAHSLLKMGALNGLSIGFFARQWEHDRGTDVRTLTDIELWEVSLVTFPANGKARVTGVKSVDEIDAPKDAEKALREAGFSKADATALVARVMRMGEERREAAQSAALAQRAAERLLASLTQ